MCFCRVQNLQPPWELLLKLRNAKPLAVDSQTKRSPLGAVLSYTPSHLPQQVRPPKKEPLERGSIHPVITTKASCSILKNQQLASCGVYNIATTYRKTTVSATLIVARYSSIKKTVRVNTVSFVEIIYKEFVC